jgi:endonuclease/exonuclease/phosphatase (EEP) superfamily protein YafD
MVEDRALRAAARGKRSGRGGRGPKLLAFLVVAYALVLALVAATNAAGPDRFWPAAINLYLPQWGWGLPAVPLFLLCLAFARGAALVPLFCGFWVAGPLMGFSFPAPSSGPPEGAVRLTVMTYNVGFARKDPAGVADEIRRAGADVVLLQDAGGVLDGPVGEALPGPTVLHQGQFVLSSRFPVLDLEYRALGSDGAAGSYHRYRLLMEGTEVTVANVHLLTPRDGLNAVRQRGASGIREIRENVAERLRQAETLARELTAEEGPVIVAGDLNAPPQSLVQRPFRRARFRNAFSDAGFGYGYTYGHALRPGHSFVRIDHILASPHWGFDRCRTGDHAGSDHRPVIADLYLRRPSPGRQQERTEATADSSGFVVGVNVAGDAVEVDGRRWLSHRQAAERGLTVAYGRVLRRPEYGFPFHPPADAGTAAMLRSAIWRPSPPRGRGIALGYPLPSGEYDVYLWIVENYRDRARRMEARIEGATARRGIAELPLGAWRRYGPYRADVRDGRLDIEMVNGGWGDPGLMGFAVYRAPR